MNIAKIKKSSLIAFLLLVISHHSRFIYAQSLDDNHIKKLTAQKLINENNSYKNQSEFYKKQAEFTQLQIKDKLPGTQIKSLSGEISRSIITTPLFFTGLLASIAGLLATLISILTYRSTLKNQIETTYLELIKRLGDTSPAIRSNAVIALPTFINSLYNKKIQSKKYINDGFLKPLISQLVSNSMNETDPRVLRRIRRILIEFSSQDIAFTLTELSRTNRPLQENLHHIIINFITNMYNIKSFEQLVDNTHLFTDLQKITNLNPECLQCIMRRKFNKISLKNHIASQVRINELSPNKDKNDLIQYINELQIAAERLKNNKHCISDILFKSNDNKLSNSTQLNHLYLGDLNIKQTLNLHNVDFESTIFSGSSFENITFEKCSFKNCRMHNMKISLCTFIDCIFINTEFFGTDINCSKFINSDISVALFSKPCLKAPGPIKNQSLYISSIINNNKVDFIYSNLISELNSFSEKNFEIVTSPEKSPPINSNEEGNISSTD